MTDDEGEWEVIYTPWWTRFGKVGNDGLTRLERRYIARDFMRKHGHKSRETR